MNQICNAFRQRRYMLIRVLQLLKKHLKPRRQRVHPMSPVGSAAQRMQRLFDKYFAKLPVASTAVRSKQNKKAVVLLTGSTGSLGSHFLDRLSVSASVRTVYCPNQGGDIEERQKTSQQEKGLPTRFENIIFLSCDLSQPLLGLDQFSYTGLLTKVTHIIHNAWDVNFNRSVDSFEPVHIHGTRQLLVLQPQAIKELVYSSLPQQRP